MTVSKRTRYEVLRRDNHTCRYCGGAAPEVVLTVDHVTPVALGGTDDPSNLVAACKDCNAGKASTSPGGDLVEDVKQTDIAWAGAMQRAAELLAAEQSKRDAYFADFLEVWPGYRTLPHDAEWSVSRLYEAGLPRAEMRKAAEQAGYARGIYDRFSYFMGIGWKKITAMQETAKALLAAEEASD